MHFLSFSVYISAKVHPNSIKIQNSQNKSANSTKALQPKKEMTNT